MIISHIFRFEKLRDGGSLIVSFQSDDSCEYWVLFPIAIFDIGNPKFKEPLLVNRTTGIEVVLSIGEAKNWLDTLIPYFNERSELKHVSKKSETEILNKILSLCKVNT